MEIILRTAMQAASFLIFQTVLLHLVEQSRFEKYIRIFSGFLLILLLVSAVLSWRGGEDLLQQVEKQVAWRLEANDFQLQLRQAEAGREAQIRGKMEERILAEAEAALMEERFFLWEGSADFGEDGGIQMLLLTVSRTQAGEDDFSRKQDAVWVGPSEIRIDEVEPVEPVQITEDESGMEAETEVGEKVGEKTQDSEEKFLAKKVAGRLGISSEKVRIIIVQ